MIAEANDLYALSKSVDTKSIETVDELSQTLQDEADAVAHSKLLLI